MSFKLWLAERMGLTTPTACGEMTIKQMQELADEYSVRDLAFRTCVSMIANAVSKCEFRTFEKGKEVKGAEYQTWNYEPNRNQNSSEFIHKLIYQLFLNNEALVIAKEINGREHLVVADSFTTEPASNPFAANRYTNVTVGNYSYQQAFAEKDVLHFVLNVQSVKSVLDELNHSYQRMLTAARENYEWASGKHWKAKADQQPQAQTADGREWKEAFQEYLENGVMPFLKNKNGILPQFNNIEFENVGGNPDTQRTTRDARALTDDIFEFTARAFSMPPVLVLGGVADTKDAMTRWLTVGIDPLTDMLAAEINRKRNAGKVTEGTYLFIDTSTIIHFDLFENADKVEKLIGSGTHSVNDVLKRIGEAEISEKWANVHYMTKNMGTMDEILNPLKGGEKE